MSFLRTHDGRLLLGAAASLLLVPTPTTGGGTDPGGGGTTDPGESPTGTTGIALVPFYLGNTRARVVIQTTAASGDTTARVPVVFTYTGEPPASVQARVVNLAASSAAVTQWSDVEGLTCDDASKTGYGYASGVPMGANYGREVRTGSVTHADTARFAVGQCGRLVGQSNMVGTLQANTEYNTQVPGSNPARTELGVWVNVGAGAFSGSDGFVAPGAITGAVGSTSMGGTSTGASAGGAMTLLRLAGAQLRAKYGRDVGICHNSNAQNSTSLNEFMPGASLDVVGASGTAAGSIGFSSPLQYAMGDFRYVALHQGEADQSLSWQARMDQLVQWIQGQHAHVAKFGRSPAQLTILLAVLGAYGVDSKGSPAVPNIEAMRRAVYETVAYAKTQGWDVRIGWTCIDLPATDAAGLHFIGDNKRIGNRRLAQSILNVVDPEGVPYSGEGPHLTGEYTRSGDDITLTVAHNGGAALVAKSPNAPITGWYANTDFSDPAGVDITLTNVTILTPTQIRVTATGAPAKFEIKHCGGKARSAQSYGPDVSNLIYDDFVYPTGANAGDQYTGRPLHETPAAIKVGA